MQRLRTISLIGAWIGLIWIVFNNAGEMQVSDIFWVNILYYVTLILLTVVTVVAVTITIRRKFQPPTAVLIVTVFIVVMAIAALDVFWLRNFLAQL